MTATTPVKPDKNPVPFVAVTNFPTLNNLSTLSQAELPPNPNIIAIHSGITDKISIAPLKLNIYSDFFLQRIPEAKDQL